MTQGLRARTILFALIGSVLSAGGASAQPGVQGQWRTLPSLFPINPIHFALLNNGKVLVVAGSGNLAGETNFQGAVWDPQTGSISTHPVGWDMFCNAMAVMPDGRVFINGGNLQYSPFLGLARSSIYDPVSGTYTDIEDMAHGRWYPTVVMFADGRFMTFSGLTESGGTNETVEIYTPGMGWSPEYPAGWTPPLYPRLHLLPNGTVFYSGPGPGSRLFNPSTKAWSAVMAPTNHGGSRLYGSSVLLPLSPADGYRPRVMIMGGGSPATATTEIIDLSAPSPQWQYGPSMSQPRIEMNATLLPNGTVLTLGGSLYDEDAATASLNADLYNPKTNTFSSAGANAFPRLYHSASLLLPDATVLLMGGNPSQGHYEPRMEIYSPAYLFNADGSPAARPTVQDVTPGPLAYGQTFQVSTPEAANIESVVLVRPGTPTHAFDPDQRLIELSYTKGSGVLNATMPPNGNIAPPGYYMLFVLNAAGVPSTARFVQLLPTNWTTRPLAGIVTPFTDVTVSAGDSVSFTGLGFDPTGISSYSWSFPGGTPSSATGANPGNVVYSTPGIHVGSLTVTNTAGLTSLMPAIRMIAVSDFTLASAPATQNVLQAGSADYYVGVTPRNGFNGTVSFAVTGLPPGASATFTPATIVGSGATTLRILTSGTTPLGNYPLTITATSGLLTRTTSPTLVVSTCAVALSASYTSPTLNLGFRIGATSPSTWTTWAIAYNVPYQLWSIPVPAIAPAVTFPVPLTPFPSLGSVYVLTTLVPATGPMCWDWKVVNTSP